jgi:hypothetical protein
MGMANFVVRDAIVPDLKAAAKESVIREMIESLRNAGYFKGGETDDIVKAVLKREQLGSTGIGRGVAIPHTKHGSVDRGAGSCIRVVDFSPGPAGRPSARSGKRVSHSARRWLRPVLAAGDHTRGHLGFAQRPGSSGPLALLLQE